MSKPEPSDVVLKRLLGAGFETEMRVGVPHFVVGQHRAEKAITPEGDEYFILVYVPLRGHSKLGLFCQEDGEHWVIEPFAVEQTNYWTKIIKLPDGFVLTKRMLEVLDVVRSESA